MVRPSLTSPPHQAKAETPEDFTPEPFCENVPQLVFRLNFHQLDAPRPMRRQLGPEPVVLQEKPSCSVVAAICFPFLSED